MAAPSFPQPMYAPLRDLSVQYILPGADLIPSESVGLMLTNPAFIEAYMVGLSHELARQLLFAGYPTDCMGTYFRQFWDVKGYVPQPGDPTDPAQLAEQLKDIPPIVTWSLSSPLGQHPNHAGVTRPLVLIVRGELLRRYPDAIIYARRRSSTATAARSMTRRPELHPIFQGNADARHELLRLQPHGRRRQGRRGGSAGLFLRLPAAPVRTEVRSGTVRDRPRNPMGRSRLDELRVSPCARRRTPLRRRLLAPFTELLLASSTMRNVLAQHPIPAFLSAGQHPGRVAITGADAGYQWGADAAQTAYITARLPFRVGIHADQMIPAQPQPKDPS